VAVATSNNTFELVQRLQQLYLRARNEKRNRYDIWTRNYRLVMNRIGAQTRTSWQPSPRTSEIYPILSAIVAWMADQHTQIDVAAAADPGSPFTMFIGNLAQDLEDVMDANWANESYEAQKKLIIWDGLTYGSGFSKTIWDQSLAGGQGNAKFIRIDPWALYFDPAATSLEDCSYIVEARRMSLDEIERRFPGSRLLLEAKSDSTPDFDEKPTWSGDSARLPKANPGNLPGAGTYGGFSGSGDGRWGGVSPQRNMDVLPGFVLYEYWLKENDPYEPDEVVEGAEVAIDTRWRIICVCAGEVLFDEYADDLELHSHPYDRWCFDDIGEMYGVSLVDHLALPQIYINRLLTAMQQNAELLGNPIFIESANAGTDRVGIINRPGQRLRISGPGGMQNKPDWLQPPSMPDSVPKLIDFWIKRMEVISGLTALSQNSSTSSLPSDSTMQSIQESAFVRIRAAISNLEETIRSVGIKLANLITVNYTEPRYVATLGPEGQKTAIALKAHHFELPTDEGAPAFKYTIQVNAGSQMPTSRQARSSQADKAYGMGIIDRQAWFEANQFPNWQRVLDRINQQIAQGTFQPPAARQRSQRKQ